MIKNLFKSVSIFITKNRTPDERNTIIVSILATIFLELGILYKIIETRKLSLSYIILFFLVILFSTLLNLSLKLY